MVLAALMACCGEGLNPSSYQPVLPVLPLSWKEILGDASWRLQWLGEDGTWKEWEGLPGSDPPEISIYCEWSTPVLAWPFWPAWNLSPGIMRPAGALFPWDISGHKIYLSWQGGVDAFFWRELAHADRSNGASEGRLPWYFDWQRFRELFSGENIPENVRLDPWLADWKLIGSKTVSSGFDRRRLVSRKFSEIAIPDMDGSWAGSSPFSRPIAVPEEGPLLLNVTESADTWVSPGGVLKCSTEGWVFRPSPAKR